MLADALEVHTGCTRKNGIDFAVIHIRRNTDAENVAVNQSFFMAEKSLCAFSPAPISIVFIGGSVASESFARASGDIWGQFVMGTEPCATFIANAMQVGLPQSLQFVFGVSLKMSSPLSAIT